MIMEINDPYDSPGFYQQSAAMRRDLGSPFPERTEGKRPSIFADTYVFPKAVEVFANHLVPRGQTEYMTVSESTPIYHWFDPITEFEGYQFHAEGTNWGFFLRDEDVKLLVKVPKPKSILMNVRDRLPKIG